MNLFHSSDKPLKKVAELENILSSIAAPMIVMDKDLKITRINDAALRVAGYSRDEVVGRMTCGQLAKTPLCGTDQCTIKNCMRGRKQITGETVLTTRDGKKIPISAACSPLFDESGNPCGGIEVIIDRSEAVRLQAQTEKQRVMLENGVKHICEVMELAASKDLTKRVDGNLDGDLKKLQGSVNLCLGELNNALGQVANASEQVSSAAEQISSGKRGFVPWGQRTGECNRGSFFQPSGNAVKNAAQRCECKGSMETLGRFPRHGESGS